MLKKTFYIFLIIIIISFNTSMVYADDIDYDNELISWNDLSEVSNMPTEEPVLNSRIAVAYDRKSGKVIWGKNENKRSAMASTTKIMTAIIAIENADLNQEVVISAKSAGTGGSRLGLKIAETVGGNIEGFANMMNDKARQLGLENTHFVTPHGLDNPEHYTTAYELAKLTDYALKNETFAKIVNTKTCTIMINGYPKAISNTNELLGYIEGVNGVKTGFTNNAGRCLVTSVKRNDFEIITVVLQADTKKFRGADSVKIINYIYDNYELLNIKEIVDEKFSDWCQINANRIEINKAKNNNMKLYITELENDIIPVKKGSKDNIDIEINNLFNFEAPVEKDKTIGNLKVCLNGEVLDVLEIKNKNTIEKRNVSDYLKIFAIELMR